MHKPIGFVIETNKAELDVYRRLKDQWGSKMRRAVGDCQILIQALGNLKAYLPYLGVSVLTIPSVLQCFCEFLNQPNDE